MGGGNATLTPYFFNFNSVEFCFKLDILLSTINIKTPPRSLCNVVSVFVGIRADITLLVIQQLEELSLVQDNLLLLHGTLLFLLNKILLYFLLQQ